MKITRIEIDTDNGKRAVSLTNFVEVDPTSAEMPEAFRELTQMLWDLVGAHARGEVIVPNGAEA